jgi:hypothetical protein
MENIQYAVITNIIPSVGASPHYGYCKLTTDGSQAYIGPNIFAANELKIGDHIYVDLTSNHKNYTHRGCMHRVTFIYTLDGPFAHLLPKAPTPANVPFELEPEAEEEGPTQAQLFQAVRDIVMSLDSFYTTAEITDRVSARLGVEMDSSDVGRDLRRLHDKGQAARLSMSRDGSAKRVSRAAWGPTSTANELFDSWFDDE